MEQYRSGHNEADSKSVSLSRPVGSNPTCSARKSPPPVKHDMVGFCCGKKGLWFKVLGLGYSLLRFSPTNRLDKVLKVLKVLRVLI